MAEIPQLFGLVDAAATTDTIARQQTNFLPNVGKIRLRNWMNAMEWMKEAEYYGKLELLYKTPMGLSKSKLIIRKLRQNRSQVAQVITESKLDNWNDALFANWLIARWCNGPKATTTFPSISDFKQWIVFCVRRLSHISLTSANKSRNLNRFLSHEKVNIYQILNIWMRFTFENDEAAKYKNDVKSSKLSKKQTKEQNPNTA